MCLLRNRPGPLRQKSPGVAATSWSQVSTISTVISATVVGGCALRGATQQLVPAVARDLGADAVHVNAEVTPFGVGRDQKVAARVELVEHDGVYATPPGSVLTNAGHPYKVFTSFFK